MRSISAAVEQRCSSWPRRSLHTERFTAKPLTEPARTDAFEVVLAQSELTLTIPPERTILDMVEEAGVGILSSCAEGTCGTCETPCSKASLTIATPCSTRTNDVPTTA